MENGLLFLIMTLVHLFSLKAVRTTVSRLRRSVFSSQAALEMGPLVCSVPLISFKSTNFDSCGSNE